MAVSTVDQETQNQVPGLAELAIQQTFPKPASKPWYKHIPFPKLPEKQNQQTASKPASKPANKTRLASLNKTSKQGLEFASLAYLEIGLQWVENLIHILTPRLLVAGFVLSLVDLLTHGNMLQNGYMIYIWAIIQALAVDATLPNMWRLAFTRFDEKRWLAGSILLLIGAGLGLVVFSALAIQFLQQSESLPLDVAMGKLHVNPEMLSYVRSGSVVFLAAILSVLNRTKVNARSVNQGQNQLVNQAQNQPGLVNQPVVNQPVNPSLPESLVNQTGQTDKLVALHLVTPGTSKQQQIRTLLESNPGISPTEIVKATGVTKGYASTQRTAYRKEKGLA